MAQDEYTVSVQYVRLIAEQLRSTGANVEAWLRLSGLDEAQLHEPARVVPYPMFRKLVLDSLAAAGEPAFGLFVGERLVASTHGMVGFAAINSSTVRQALDVVQQFVGLRTSMLSISHEVDAHEARVQFHEALPLGDIQRPMLESVVLSVKNVLDEITMGRCPVGAVAFPFEAPEYAPLARDLFGCEVRYGQAWTGLSGPPEALDIPLKLADAATFKEAALICQRELDRLAASESLSTRVRRLLLERQHGFPSLAITARLFHMTPRTLHRRLVDEGTSYRALLESVRHTLAIEHLKSGRFSLDEIAYRLGYTDLANFRRAFKRWEGVPPSGFRVS